jgi:hypothetical protein
MIKDPLPPAWLVTIIRLSLHDPILKFHPGSKRFYVD